MIKFFRKIRQNLLSEGKTGKYFKYAIGEIVLVVIGILIALQINNWNENRKTNNLKQIYYKQLLSDLEADKNYADSTILILNSQIKKYEVYKSAYEEPNLAIQSTIDKMLESAGPTHNFKFKTSTINSLINTGQINLLDIEMRDMLAKYDGSKNQTETLHAYNTSFAGGLSQKVLTTAGAPDLLMRLRNQKLLSGFLEPVIKIEDSFLIMEGYLWLRNTSNTTSIHYLNELKNDADQIITILNNKIKK